MSYTAPTEIEGEFATWVIVVDTDISALTSGFIPTRVDNEGNIAVRHTNTIVQLYDINATQIVSLITASFTGADFDPNISGSVLNKYMTFIEAHAVADVLHVYSKGVQLIALPVPPSIANAHPSGCAMSPNGKYIVLIGNNVAGTHLRLVVLQGA